MMTYPEADLSVKKESNISSHRLYEQAAWGTGPEMVTFTTEVRIRQAYRSRCLQPKKEMLALQATVWN